MRNIAAKWLLGKNIQAISRPLTIPHTAPMATKWLILPNLTKSLPPRHPFNYSHRLENADKFCCKDIKIRINSPTFRAA